MGKKLLEQSGQEMAATLVALAGPLAAFMKDEQFIADWNKATKKGITSKATNVLQIYSIMVPHLLGKKHLKDTITILAAVEGKTVRELMEMNGTDLLADALLAWAEQIQPFFLRLGISA